MASLGYIVVCVDGRGTGGRGEAFEKCTYLKIGVKEAKDQVETALYLGKQPYVDKDRIGIWGWSYGGYMTLMSMSEGTPVFKAGVAVAAPTDWRFYDTIYTERFMRTPKENAEGSKNHPLSHGLTNCTAICCWYMVWQTIMFTSRTVQNMPSIWCSWVNNLICKYIPIVIMAYTAATPVSIYIHD